MNQLGLLIVVAHMLVLHYVAEMMSDIELGVLVGFQIISGWDS